MWVGVVMDQGGPTPEHVGGSSRGSGGPPPEHYEFGGYDFLYSGAFWDWPLPKNLFRFLAYVC